MISHSIRSSLDHHYLLPNNSRSVRIKPMPNHCTFCCANEKPSFLLNPSQSSNVLDNHHGLAIVKIGDICKPLSKPRPNMSLKKLVKKPQEKVIQKLDPLASLEKVVICGRGKQPYLLTLRLNGFNIFPKSHVLSLAIPPTLIAPWHCCVPSYRCQMKTLLYEKVKLKSEEC